MTHSVEKRTTQTQHPWRSTARTAFQFVVGLAVIFPFVIDAAGVPNTIPWVAAGLTVAAGVTRVMALPQVEEFLSRFFPYLASDPDASYWRAGTVVPPTHDEEPDDDNRP